MSLWAVMAEHAALKRKWRRGKSEEAGCVDTISM
jgi:hypothetical protein